MTAVDIGHEKSTAVRVFFNAVNAHCPARSPFLQMNTYWKGVDAHAQAIFVLVWTFF